MTIGDVLEIIAGVLATGFALASILTALALLFPERIHAAQSALEKHPARSFGRGLVVALVAGLGGFALARTGNGLLMLIGWGALIVLLSLALVGSAGLASVVAQRILKLDRRARPLRALWRGCGILIAAGFMPFIGWFLIFPISLIFCLGAGAEALQELRRAVKQAVPIPAIPGAPAATELGA